MKKILKFIKNNILGFLVGLSLCLNGVVIAENIITANQVTYKDSTVQTELDSLFDAVDINERLGNTDEISNIGDGTVSSAISTLNNGLIKEESREILFNGSIRGGDTIHANLVNKLSNYRNLYFVMYTGSVYLDTKTMDKNIFVAGTTQRVFWYDVSNLYYIDFTYVEDMIVEVKANYPPTAELHCAIIGYN